MFTIILIIILGFFAYLIIKSKLNLNYVKKVFQRNNTIVFGKKGTGKDMMFQVVINARKKLHYSNITYNSNTLPIKLNDITLFPNSYENLINDNIEKVVPHLYENFDIYLSDGGTYLPSQYDYMLHKKYTSLPLLYALQRHLYNSNFHVNVQSLSRLWKPLRELADGYIKMEHTTFIGFIYILTFTYYDRYESAEQSLLPMPKKLLSSTNNAMASQYVATNGIIKPMFIIGFKSRIKYDTRHFKNVFFKDPNKDVIADKL
jgi:hypothetical protein